MDIDSKYCDMESDDEEETEEIESKRRVIMRQILNELLVINNEFETTKPYSFTPLEAISEEITPCSSSQYLENKFSTLKEDLQAQDKSDDDLELNISLSEEDDVQIKNPRKEKYETNILFVKHDSPKNKKKEYVHQSLKISPKSQTLLPSDFQSQSDFFKNKKRSYEINKFNSLINNDERFSKQKSGKKKFKTLNKDYDKLKINRSKYCWTIKTDEEPEKTKKYCGDVNFVCHNTYSRKTKPEVKFEVDYEKCTTEELEERLKYFENQLQKLKDEYNETEQEEVEYPRSSYEDDTIGSSPNESRNLSTWRSQISQTSNLYEKNKDDSSHTFGDSDGRTEEDNSPTDQQIAEQKKEKDREESFENEDSIEEINLKPKEATYSGTIIIVKNCSCETTDSGLHTSHSTNKSSQYLSENVHQPDVFPRIMLARSSKNVSTQVVDEDWFRICEAKREMSAVQSRTHFSVSSSDDESYLKNREQMRRKVLFTTHTVTVNNEFSDSSTDKDLNLRFSVDTTNTDLSQSCCYCFPCSNLFRFLFTKNRR